MYTNNQHGSSAAVNLDGLFEELHMQLEYADTVMTDAPPSASLPSDGVEKSTLVTHPARKSLNVKAITVKLTTTKPRTTFNDDEAAKAARDALGDNGINANVKLFKDPSNPIKRLLNDVNAVYIFTKKNTLPYQDRGPRLLPIANYEDFRDKARALKADVDAKIHAMDEAAYYKYVDLDVLYRNRDKFDAVGNTIASNRASRADYQTYKQFIDAVAIAFDFRELPATPHFLFDEDKDESDALDAQVWQAAQAELRARIQKPLDKLVAALKTQPGKDEDGKRVGIFRDTTVTNVTEAVDNVRSLAMDDPDVIAACDMVEQTMKPIANNPDVVRESPVVREAAAKKLAEVASKMGAFFGG